jgi:hypothetical protein
MATRMIGAVLYQGPSLLDGRPIVVIVTGFSGSANTKTGKMLQTWIMRADEDPGVIAQSGRDGSICGNCPQRRSLGGSCYVVVEQAPLTIWRAWQAGRYEDWRAALPHGALKGRSVRFGSYGDPAAVPPSVWRRVREQKLEGWTGYTHQWRNAIALRPFLMASVDNQAEMLQAQEAGWRTFRVRDESEPMVMTAEVECPSERVTCETCGLCRGRSRVAKSVAIVAHGYLLGRRAKRLPVAV